MRQQIHEEVCKGGPWLGAARTWLQNNIQDGDSINWDSTQTVSISVCDLEYLAREVAIAAIEQERKQINRNQKISSAIKYIPIDQIMQLDYFKNRGARFIPRALSNDKQSERERAFSDVIKKFHEQSCTGGMVNIAETKTDEALQSVFTTFQWLATNIGNSVLEQALQAVGKRIVNIEE